MIYAVEGSAVKELHAAGKDIIVRKDGTVLGGFFLVDTERMLGYRYVEGKKEVECVEATEVLIVDKLGSQATYDLYTKPEGSSGV